MVKDLPGEQEMQVRFLGWEDPLEKEMATHYSCVGKPKDTGSLEGCRPWGRLESDMAEQLSMYIPKLV